MNGQGIGTGMLIWADDLLFGRVPLVAAIGLFFTETRGGRAQAKLNITI